MEKLELLYTVGRNVKWWSCCWKHHGVFKKLKIELPCDSEILLLGIYAKEWKAGTRKDTCTLMFIAALFTRAKRWKQPKYPSVEEWINKMWCIHTKGYFSALKRKEILTYATWTKFEDIMLSELRQSQKDKYCMISLIWCVKEKICCLPFRFYKDQAISHCSCPPTVCLRGIQDGEKQEAFWALDTSP